MRRLSIATCVIDRYYEHFDSPLKSSEKTDNFGLLYISIMYTYTIVVIANTCINNPNNSKPCEKWKGWDSDI